METHPKQTIYYSKTLLLRPTSHVNYRRPCIAFGCKKKEKHSQHEKKIKPVSTDWPPQNILTVCVNQVYCLLIRGVWVLVVYFSRTRMLGLVHGIDGDIETHYNTQIGQLKKQYQQRFS